MEKTGFTNSGSNTCFLNCIVQMLYHTDAFREAMLSRRCRIKGEGCIACLLSSVFSAYRSASSPLSLKSLQSLLSSLYSTFTKGSWGDAMEALAKILLAIHCSEIMDECQGIDEESANQSCNSRCPSHKVFNIGLLERMECDCGKSSESTEWDSSTYFQPFYASTMFDSTQPLSYELLTVPDQELIHYKSQSSVLPYHRSLCQHLRVSLSQQSSEECAGGDLRCPFKNSRRIIRLVHAPEVLLINIIWTESYPRVSYILKMLCAVPDALQLNEIYDGVYDQSYLLRAFICFGCGHYVSYMYENGSWVKYDDEIIRVFKDKHEMLFDMISGNMRPVGIEFVTSEDLSQFKSLKKKEWLALEKKALSMDHFYEEEKVLAQGSIKSTQPEDESDFWDCSCGFINKKFDICCSKCSTVRQGVNVWVCSLCTGYNNQNSSVCMLCDQPKDSKPPLLYQQTTKEYEWNCLCGNTGIVQDVCDRCGRKEREKNLCFLCRTFIHNNVYCYTCDAPIVMNSCRRCINYISKGICAECRNNTWLCIFCRERRSSQDSKCPECKHLRFRSFY